MGARGQALTQSVTVTRNEHEPEALEVIAGAIIKVADALDGINRGPLKRRAVLVLLQDATKLPMGTIEDVLDAAPKLRAYVK